MANGNDVIIVGGGPSGLLTGALLANAGRKVLLLEEDDEVGGRATCIKYHGHVLDNGAHGPGNTGYIEEVFRTLGRPCPEKISAFIGTEVYDYDRGRWFPFRELFSFKEVRRIIERDVLGVSPDDFAKYDDVSLEKWVSERSTDEGTRLFFWTLAMAFCHGNRFEPISTGEFLLMLRQLLDTWGGLRQVAGVFAGGYAKVIEPLVAFIKEKGGEIRTGTRVSNIVVEAGRATGVEIESGPKLFPAHIVDVEFLQAPSVICTLPIWDIFSVISERNFPAWWVDWMHSIERKVCINAGIIAGFDKPLWDEQITRWVPRLKRSGLVGNFQFMPGYGSAANEYQAVFALQGNYDEMPDLLTASKCDSRQQMRKLIDDMEEDLREVTPEFELSCTWKVRYGGFYNLAMTPGLVGAHRIPMQPPGIRNLYWSSDTVREARGVGGGIEFCAKAALRCVELVTEAQER